MSSSDGQNGMGAMFLWWLTPNIQKDHVAREESKEIETLDQPESEVAGSGSYAKKSKVSKARYNQWLIAEEKRLQGGEVRAELDYHKQRFTASSTAFASAVQERVKMSHAERLEAEKRSHELREGVRHLGQEMKAQSDDSRDKSEELKRQWRKLGTENRHKLGTELKERVFESRRQKREEKHTDAFEYKQRIADQAAQQAERDEKALQEKRATIARIRSETATPAIQSAKDFYYSQRKQTAETVRSDVSEWADEKQRNFNNALAKAHANKAMAKATDDHAADGRLALQLDHLHTAEEMRLSLQKCQERHEHNKKLDELRKRGAYERACRQGFVTRAEARQVESSPFTILREAHRDESFKTKSGRIIAKETWRTYVFTNGWFSNWFGDWSTPPTGKGSVGGSPRAAIL
jgi:hypothetical protein